MLRDALRHFDERFTAPGTAERFGAVRLLVSLFATVFVAVRASYVLDISALSASRFQPIGLWYWLADPLPLAVVWAIIAVTLIAGVLAAAGLYYRLSGPALAVGFLLFATYDNSWQHIAHTENLLALHLLVLPLAGAAGAFSFSHRRRHDVERYGWPLRVMSMITVATYVVAGIAKVRNGGMEWLEGDVLRSHIANDNVRKAVLGDAYSEFGGWLVARSWVFVPMALGTMVVEFGAPLALVRSRLRPAIVFMIWLFHAAIVAVMAIVFIYPLSGVAFASLLHPERALERLSAVRPASRRAVAIT